MRSPSFSGKKPDPDHGKGALAASAAGVSHERASLAISPSNEASGTLTPRQATSGNVRSRISDIHGGGSVRPHSPRWEEGATKKSTAVISVLITLAIGAGGCSFYRQQLTVLGLQLWRPFDLFRVHHPETPGPRADHVLADAVLLRHLRHGRPISLPQDIDHLFFCESTLAHDFLSSLWKPSFQVSIGAKGRGQVNHDCHGLMTATPAASKGRVLRVATERPFATAIAAMQASAVAMAYPADRASAIRST